MGAPYKWELIADHLWDFIISEPKSWSRSMGDISNLPTREIFNSWVKQAVEDFDDHGIDVSNLTRR